jgi:phenylacetate-coenzyme A ligase PaaK-like adenylate-forming protein
LTNSPGRKAAQISVLPEFESVQPFRHERWHEIESFSPNILVGYAFDLRRFAEKSRARELQVPSVDRAIFALTDCGSNPLADPLRDQLWHLFGVPIYELIIAPGCRLLAAECEAHDGWHLQDGVEAYLVRDHLIYDAPPLNGLHTGFTGQIDTAPCACGRPTVRLKNLAPHLPRPFERRIAAVA